MRRRTVLASLGVALAGCSSRPSSSGEETTTESRATPTTRETVTTTTELGIASTTDDGEGGLTVEGGTTDAPDLGWSVEKVSAATKEEPCRLRIAVENTGDAREVTAVGLLPLPPTPGRPADGDDGFLPAVVPAGDYDPQVIGGCWGAPIDRPDVADDAPWDWGYGEPESQTLPAGERVEREYHVLSSTTRFCYQRGDYRFVRGYELDGEEYEWSFTLGVPSYGRW